MRVKKRLLVIVTTLMLVFFAGSAYALTSLPLEGIVSLSPSGSIEVSFESLTLYPPENEPRFELTAAPTLDGSFIDISYNSYFTAPGQQVVMNLLLENISGKPVFIEGVRRTPPSGAEMPEWLYLDYYASEVKLEEGVVIAPGQATRLTVTTGLKDDFRTDGSYFSDETAFDYAILYSPGNGESVNEGSGDYGGNGEDRGEISANDVDLNQNRDDSSAILPEAFESPAEGTLAIDGQDIPPADRNTDESLSIDGQDMPLAEMDIEELFSIDNQDMPLAELNTIQTIIEEVLIPLMMPLTGLRDFLPFLLSGLIVTMAAVVVLAALIHKQKKATTNETDK